MKLTLLREHLLKGLNIVEHGISSSSHLPILASIRIDANNGNEVTLVSTNLELAIVHTLIGKVSEPGTVVIPFGVMRDILKNLTAEKIHLHLEGSSVSVNADNYEALITAENPDDFPIIPPISKKNNPISILSGLLKNIFNKTIVSTQYSEIRPELNGIYFNLGDDGLVCAGTDSFRLVEYKSDAGGPETECVIPLKTVDTFVRIFSDEDEVELFFDENQVLAESKHTALISRLVDGKFPNYKDIIPKDSVTVVHSKRGELENALKVVRVFSGKANDVSLFLENNGKILRVESRENSVGENKYRVPVKTVGNSSDMKVSFNWKYLLDGIGIYGSDEISLGINGTDKPVVIRGKGEENLVYVVMPIRE